MKGVLLFGDSIIAGMGASSREQCCAKLIKATLPYPVSLKGRNRDTSRNGLERLDKDVLSQAGLFSHVVILFGNNDSWLESRNQPIAQVSCKEFGDNLSKMITCIRGGGQTPLVCNLQPVDSTRFFSSFPEYRVLDGNAQIDPNGWQKQYSDVCENVAASFSVQLVDIRRQLEPLGVAALSGDGIHPNDLGHRTIANKIIEEIKAIAFKGDDICRRQQME